MPLVTGRLSDLTSLSLAHKEPELIFTLNSANASGGSLYPSYPSVIKPDGNGYFQADLAATEDMVDNGWYGLQIRMLGPSSSGNVIVDFPDWRITVPRSGGIISKLIAQRGTNPSLVWQSTEPPLMPHVGMKWLDTNTGRLYSFRAGSWNAASANSDWVLVHDLTGPAGYNALGTEPQQQTIADWMLGVAGDNPLKDALDEAVSEASVNSETFMPTASVQFKKHPSGYRYEVVRVRCNGRPRPGVFKRIFASDFDKTSPGGDNFIIPAGKEESVQSMSARSGADIAFNASGWQTLSNNNPPLRMVRGVQIAGGVIYRDFEPSSNRGRHALGVHDDGRILPYRIEDGHTAAGMVAEGVVDTLGFGPLLVRNGLAQDIQSQTWAGSLVDGSVSGRTIFGVTKNHDILLITVVGESALGIGVGGNNISALAASEGCHHAIMLDGGGSTQAVADGLTYHPSSDSAQFRAVGDAGLLFARVTQAPDSSLTLGAEPLNLDTAVAAPNVGVYQPGAIVRAGQVTLTGQLVPAGGGTWPANEWIVVGSVPDKARPNVPLGSGGFYTGELASVAGSARVQIRAYGQMSISLSAPATAVNLSGISYAAF